MAEFLGSDMNVLGYETRWVDGHQLRTRTRKLGDLDKIVVDVLEMSERWTSLARSRSVARQVANRYGARDFAATQLADIQIDKKIGNQDGEIRKVRIRHTSYAFEGPQK